jgi:hypothetical protein
MNQKTPRPMAPGGAHRAGTSKGLGGTFEFQFSSETSEQQEDSEVPIAHTRIVIGRKWSFIYIEYCPLCGLEHMHGKFALRGPNSDPLQAFEDGGLRVAHCVAHGLGRVARRIRGEWRTVERKPPPEYHKPEGVGSYQMVLSYPACFTPRGIKNKDAKALMERLARRAAPTSQEILKPRRSFVLLRGDFPVIKKNVQ